MLITRRLSVPAEAPQLAQLVGFASQAAVETGFDSKSVHLIELAVDEACSNIIHHAYSGADGHITLETRVEPRARLTVVLTDNGKPFDPAAVVMPIPGAPLEKVQVGGLGLYLMRVAMDTVDFEFGVPGVGNRLTMTKTLTKKA